MGYTLAEKILLAHSTAARVRPGQIIMVRCDLVMANDVSGPLAFRAMEAMGARRVFDPERAVMVADHFAPARDARSAELLRRLKEWSESQGVTFYDQGRGGIEHTLLVEEGWVVPGSVIAGGDSHTCTYGALGAFGTGLGSTDIAFCLAFGEFWQVVPATIQVEFTGSKQPFVTGKDLILAVIAELGVGGAVNHVLEFVGPGAEALSVDERLAVANMAVEAGAETGLFPADVVTSGFLAGRARRPWTAERSDRDADFARRIRIDLDRLPPLVALPHQQGGGGGQFIDNALFTGNQLIAGGGGRGPPGRPGLHWQLRQRHTHRPASGGPGFAGPEGSPQLPAHRCPGHPPDLPGGSAGRPH